MNGAKAAVNDVALSVKKQESGSARAQSDHTHFKI